MKKKQLHILDTGKCPRGGVVVQKRFSLTRHRHRPASFCQTHPPTYSRPAWHAFALPLKSAAALSIPQCVTILATSYWGNDALQGRYVGEVRKYSEKTFLSMTNCHQKSRWWVAERTRQRKQAMVSVMMVVLVMVMMNHHR